MTGQSFGAFVGTIVGGYFFGAPGAMIGGMLGGAIGRLLDPPKAPKAPKVGDLSINSYVRNAPVGVLFGQDKVVGGCIARGGVSSDSSESGSKKGGSKITTTMSVAYAVAHCEGTVAEADPKRAWLDDKVIGDRKSNPIDLAFDNGCALQVYLGEEVPTANEYFTEWYSTDLYPFPLLKYTCWTAVFVKFEGQIINALPNFAIELRGFCTEEGEHDANPVRAAYLWLTNTRYGMGISIDSLNGDPDTVGSPWKTAADQCDQLIDYIDIDDSIKQEPIFRYSRWIGEREKGFDTLVDLFTSCRGLLRYKQGKLEPLIENENEEAEYYYSERIQIDFVTLGGCTVNRIYADFSAYPDLFWSGSSGTILNENGTILEFFIYNQTSTYIDLCDDLAEAFESGITFTLLKDNIKEGSFTFTMIPDSSIANMYRIEFINRYLWNEKKSKWEHDYQLDVIEHESPEYYSLLTMNNVLNHKKVKEVKFLGVKRKTQAMRMAYFLSDVARYSRLMCSFTIGAEGYIHAVGDIIGVSHIQPGWDKKLFRIISLEEKEEFEIDLSCIEYIPHVYKDRIVKLYSSGNGSIPTPYELPDHVERLNIIQDLTANTVWICFKRPDDNPYWLSAKVYVSYGVSDDYEYVKTVSVPSSSVKLSASIDAVQTTISFDSSTLYGSFPDSGSFWVEDELISYTGITANSFTGCSRTYGVTHDISEYCSLKDAETPYITFQDTDIGNYCTIKVVSCNAAGILADEDTAPTDTVLLV